MAIKLTAGGKVILKDGKPSCTCCEQFELAIKYDWAGTGQYDLDTKTEAFGETVGWSCGDGVTYIAWLAGGDGNQDDTSLDGFERVDVRVDLAKTDSLWTSSYNIECYAGWYDSSPVPGSGPFQLSVTYKGDTKTESIPDPGSSNACVTAHVATITVYADEQGDGTYFEIIVL